MGLTAFFPAWLLLLELLTACTIAGKGEVVPSPSPVPTSIPPSPQPTLRPTATFLPSPVPLTKAIIASCPVSLPNVSKPPDEYYISTATYYILGVAVTLYGSPVTAVFIFAVYGAARASLVWLFGWQNRVPGSVERLTFYMDLTKPIMRQVNGFALAMAGAYLISVYL